MGQGSRVTVEGEGGSGGGWRESGDVNRDISYISKAHATKQRQSKRGNERGKMKREKVKEKEVQTVRGKKTEEKQEKRGENSEKGTKTNKKIEIESKRELMERGNKIQSSRR